MRYSTRLHTRLFIALILVSVVSCSSVDFKKSVSKVAAIATTITLTNKAEVQGKPSTNGDSHSNGAIQSIDASKNQDKVGIQSAVNENGGVSITPTIHGVAHIPSKPKKSDGSNALWDAGHDVKLIARSYRIHQNMLSIQLGTGNDVAQLPNPLGCAIDAANTQVGSCGERGISINQNTNKLIFTSVKLQSSSMVYTLNGSLNF